eukprot:TRINITY_DN8760_c0_g1_i1.p1 TRINITY_DN8760_c0_g1~~TRINITY_DN8760_c0_g1_i1.p1  ORF type:complete len:432 (-),score=133.87 TRINITY_DN8760_c0_g1_i1:78-1352(-)
MDDAADAQKGVADEAVVAPESSNIEATLDSSIDGAADAQQRAPDASESSGVPADAAASEVAPTQVAAAVPESSHDCSTVVAPAEDIPKDQQTSEGHVEAAQDESNKEDAHKEATAGATNSGDAQPSQTPQGKAGPATPAFDAPGTPAFQGRKAAATDGKPPEVKPVGPLRKMLLKFDPASFELFMQKHPHVIDATDAKIRSFADQFVEVADLSNVKVSHFLKSVADRFGEQRPERSARTKGMLTEAVTRKFQKEEKEKADQSKGKDKTRSGQLLVKTVTSAPTSKKRMKEEQEEGAVVLTNVQDIEWAATLLAPLGLKKDGELLVKPPMQVALPALRGLRVIETWRTGKAMKNMLKQTKIGKIVHGLRKHPEPEVVKAAKELEIALRYACSKEAAIKAEAAEAAAAAAAEKNAGAPEAKKQRKA